MCSQEKLKMCKFPLNASVQKPVAKYFGKILQSACFCYWLAKELKKDWK